jgi:cell division protein FtsB
MTTSRFIALLSLSIAASGTAFVTHLALRFQNIAAGYRVQEARNEGQRLRERANQLRIELAARRAPQALTEMGRSELGMVEADRVLTLVAGGAARPARLSGRPR